MTTPTVTLALPDDLSTEAIENRFAMPGTSYVERDRYGAQVYLVYREIIEGVTGGHWVPSAREIRILPRRLDTLSLDWLEEIRRRLADEDWTEVWNETNPARELMPA